MSKEQTNFRIDSEAKERAYAAFKQMGLRPTDAVNMFMHHIAMFGELPFQPRIPNAETIKTMEKTDNGKELIRHNSVDDMFSELDI